jgi:hypothetical protein
MEVIIAGRLFAVSETPGPLSEVEQALCAAVAKVGAERVEEDLLEFFKPTVPFVVHVDRDDALLTRLRALAEGPEQRPNETSERRPNDDE